MKSTRKKSKSAGIGDEAVQAKTGRTWAEWFSLLDKAGAKQMGHKAIVAHLGDRHRNLNGWWRQMITVAYERARGKRHKHQTPEGYQVSSSRTLEVPLELLYAAWTDRDTRDQWLPDAAFSIRKATPEKSLRLAWEDGSSRVDVSFSWKGESRSQVTVDHRRLPNAAEAKRMKSYWKLRLNQLQAALESPPPAGGDT